MNYRERDLLDYLEGQLDARTREGLEKELVVSAECRERLEALASTLRLVGQGETPRLNPLQASGFLHRVRQGIEARRRRSRRRQWGLGLAGALGLAAFLAWRPLAPGSTLEEDPVPGLDPEGAYTLYGGYDDNLEFNLLVDEYLLETASTEELLGEVDLLAFEDDLIVYPGEY